MVKCQNCYEGKCENKYENRHLCHDPNNCSCSCQESAGNRLLKGIGSVLFGVVAFASGVFLTLSTGGLEAIGIAAVIGGSVLTGTGATATIHPIAKQLNGERMTGKEYKKDIFISGAIGAITGPIGSVGAITTKSIASAYAKQTSLRVFIKLTCRTVAGQYPALQLASYKKQPNTDGCNLEIFSRVSGWVQ